MAEVKCSIGWKTLTRRKKSSYLIKIPKRKNSPHIKFHIHLKNESRRYLEKFSKNTERI